MADSEPFVLELASINRLASCPVAGSEVATLSHESVYDSMKAATLICEGPAADFRFACFPSTKLPEILARFRNYIFIQFNLQSPCWRSANFYVHENTGIGLKCVLTHIIN